MDEYLLEQGLEKAEERLQAGIEARRAQNTLVKQYGPGEYLSFECDCGAELPIERMEYGLLKCTECQEKFERRQKMNGR